MVMSVLAWARIPRLFTKLYQLAILREVYNRIGRTIRVEHSTQKTERWRFAKVVVELDLSKPLETEACVDDVWYPILYESLPQVCFSCGRTGHLLVNCRVEVAVPLIVLKGSSTMGYPEPRVVSPKLGSASTMAM
ncbi:hypothetical protein Tsubulata_019146 [Turnera subulata]|uniref:CCHC-type domain-containing protein n=1 Tax=Turnera subulata TaxID=218843 RepID=A0A9Q0G4P7_9ROSI|nr:hypothetical protein Tsubulata_019146 [Turnera subulata]